MADASHSRTLTVPAQTVLIGQGEDSRDIYYWKAGGRVRIVVDDEVLREIAFDPKTPYFFGDLSALLGKPRSSTVETLTENTFLRIPYEPGKIEAFLKAAPHIAQQWLSTLARTAVDGMEALRHKQHQLEEARERLQHVEKQARIDKRRWRGALFLTERATLKSGPAQPAVAGLMHYLEELKLFGTKRGSAVDMEPSLIPPEVKKVLF